MSDYSSLAGGPAAGQWPKGPVGGAVPPQARHQGREGERLRPQIVRATGGTRSRPPWAAGRQPARDRGEAARDRAADGGEQAATGAALRPAAHEHGADLRGEGGDADPAPR